MRIPSIGGATIYRFNSPLAWSFAEPWNGAACDLASISVGSQTLSSFARTANRKLPPELSGTISSTSSALDQPAASGRRQSSRPAGAFPFAWASAVSATERLPPMRSNGSPLESGWINADCSSFAPAAPESNTGSIEARNETPASSFQTRSIFSCFAYYPTTRGTHHQAIATAAGLRHRRGRNNRCAKSSATGGPRS